VTDDRLETIIGNLLRWGVGLSAAVVLAGGVWYLAASGASGADYHHFRGDVQGLSSLASLSGPQAVILIGLLILIATPLARVVFSLVAFASERDWAYVGITAIVLGVLLYSVAMSF
jgi:uncharacterized membrane protein